MNSRYRHPLELIPWFRRFPRSWRRDLVYTFIWNIGFAVCFLLVAVIFDPYRRAHIQSELWADFLITNCIGYTIHFGFDFTGWIFGRRCDAWPMWGRGIYYVCVPVAGVLIGYVLGLFLLSLDLDLAIQLLRRDGTSLLLLALTISLILMIVLFARERQAQSETVLAHERSRSAEAEQRALLSHLKMLQAQIEPHFLFNTLANVVSLIDSDAPKAKSMLENFIQYLRASLGSTREDTSTLGREAELLRAYLNVLAVRMGPRLSLRIDIPAELMQAPLPPMLLQPLVENAVKHGLEPKIEGGELAVAARREGELLLVTVADSGLGIDGSGSTRTQGTGLGLRNLRERLATLYGGRASLQLADRVPSGTEVLLRIPLNA
jgi:two-component sensor histidine kinase